MKKNNSTILVTGGAGFIGSNLIDELLKLSHNIICVDNFNDYYSPQLKEKNISGFLQNPKFRLFKIDIRDKDAMSKIFQENKIDIVIHLAACAGVRESFNKPREYIKTNIVGTINILELMKKHNIEKIVFASSSSVYGNCKKTKFKESLKDLEPISLYACTKLTCEKILYVYAKHYNIKAICLRLFTVFGPKQRPDLAIRKFVELIKQNLPIPVYGDGNTIRDYTYIDDIVAGIISSIDYDKTPYEIINLASGNPKTLIETIAAIEESLNQKAIIIHLPMQKGDVDRTFADIQKAKKILNYKPKTDFLTGIKKFIEWLDSQKDENSKK